MKTRLFVSLLTIAGISTLNAAEEYIWNPGNTTIVANMGGNGQWSNSGSNNVWWDGTQNVAKGGTATGTSKFGTTALGANLTLQGSGTIERLWAALFSAGSSGVTINHTFNFPAGSNYTITDGASTGSERFITAGTSTTSGGTGGNAIFTFNIAPDAHFRLQGNNTGNMIGILSAYNISGGNAIVLTGGGNMSIGEMALLRLDSSNSRLFITGNSTLHFLPGSVLTGNAAATLANPYAGNDTTRIALNNATLNIDGGTVITSYRGTYGPISQSATYGIMIGNATGAQGIVNLKSGNLTALGDPRYSTAPSTVTSNPVNEYCFAGILFGPASTNPGGEFNMTGGNLTVSDFRTAANVPNARLNFNGGNLTVSTASAPNGGNDTLTPTDDDLQYRLDNFITGFANNNTNHVALGNDGLNIDTAKIDTAKTNGIATISSVLRNISGQNGTLTKLGANTLLLTALNTYTGNTTVAAGTLLNNGTIAGTTIIDGSSTLAGNGSFSDIHFIGNSTTLDAAPGLSAQNVSSESGFTIALNLDSITNSGTSPITFRTLSTNGIITLNLSGTGSLTRYTLLNITGTSSTLTTSNFTLTNAPAGTNFSFNGTHLLLGSDITPVAPAVATQPPATLLFREHETATISATISGTGPLSYQWNKDGAPITGNPTAQTPVLVLNDPQVSDSGNYTLTATNNAGTITTDATALSIILDLRPLFTTDLPATLTLNATETLNLSVTTTGEQPISYQWFFNDTPIPAATTSTLNIPDLADANAGAYHVTASNSAGNTTSSTLNLSIYTPPPPPTTIAYEYPSSTNTHTFPWYGYGALYKLITTPNPGFQIPGPNSGAGTATGVRHAVAHFANPAAPATLEVGDTLTLTAKLTPIHIVPVGNPTQALRFGLFNSRNLPENILITDDMANPSTSTGYVIRYDVNGNIYPYPRVNQNSTGNLVNAHLIASLTSCQISGLNFSSNHATTEGELQPNQTYLLTLSVSRTNETTNVITASITGGHFTNPDAPSTRLTTTAAAAWTPGIVTQFDTVAFATNPNATLDTVQFTDVKIAFQPRTTGNISIAYHPYPLNHRILVGGNVTLYAAITGGTSTTYQWLKDGQPVPGATKQTLTLTNATLDQNGNYALSATNDGTTLVTNTTNIAVRTTDTLLAPTPASCIANHMVLQRNQTNTIWGTTNPGDPITVTLTNTADNSTRTASTTADPTGAFSVSFPIGDASATPHTLAISNPLDTTTLTDILIGDLWLCGGQSNMEWMLTNTDNSVADIASADDYPLIRVYQSAKAVSILTPLETNTGTWLPSNSSTIGTKTAIGFLFARTLAQTTHAGIPIGILHVNYGGSTAQAWMEREKLRDLGYTTYANNTTQTAANPHQVPAGLYNAMLHPIRHTSLAGVLWYQGESNSASATSPAAYYAEYYSLFPDLIRHWRNDIFQNPDLPFYFVQLANYTTPSDYFNTRNAQASTLSLPHTAMAIAIDIGIEGNIHPTNKYDVAIRLALHALNNLYDRPLNAFGPAIATATTTNGSSTATLSFTNTNNLTLLNQTLTGNEITTTRPAFEIAGTDNIFYLATATLNPDNTLTLSSPNVATPAKVRYLWHNTPAAILYNTTPHPVTGQPYLLPADPFPEFPITLAPDIDPTTLTTDQLLLYALTNTTTPTTNDGTTTHLPTTTITNGTLSLTFTPTRPDLTYEVQQSTDLQSWTTIQTLPPAEITGTPTTINSTTNTTTTPAQFLRLKVSPTNP